MSRLFFVVVAGLMLNISGGCATVMTPNWGNPGPVVHQRALAERFDPFPETEIGPEIPGARPRGFEHQLPEPARARWLVWNSQR